MKKKTEKKEKSLKKEEVDTVAKINKGIEKIAPIDNRIAYLRGWLNFWRLMAFALCVMLIFTLVVKIGNPNPKSLDYRYCVDNYIWGGNIGRLCCVENPYETEVNKCAFYYQGGENVEQKENPRAIGWVENSEREIAEGSGNDIAY